MTGPPPKPTQLKVLEGNPGKRPLNENEPQLEPALLRPPKELTDARAKKEWKRVAKILYAAGILTEADQAMLFGYCYWWGEFLRLDEIIRANNLDVILVERPDGTTTVKNSPYALERRKSFENAINCAKHLGLSPAERSRLKTAWSEEDEWETFRKGKSAK